jgi:hypothetical protein
MNAKGNGLPKIRTVYEDISPERATELLKLNTVNRRPKENKIKEFSQIMALGKWRTTHQGIAINTTTNTLIDGQNRLMAVIKSSVTVRMAVTYQEEDTFNVIDSGTKRSAFDALTHEGIPMATRLAPAIKLISWFEAIPFNTPIQSLTGPKAVIPNDMLVEYVLANPELIDCTHEAEYIARELGKRGIVSAIAAALFVIKKHTVNSEATIKEFRLRLADGQFLTEGHPVHTLRRWITMSYEATYPYQRSSMAMLLFLKAWTAFAEGKEVSRLTFRTGKDHKPNISSASEKMEGGNHDN